MNFRKELFAFGIISVFCFTALAGTAMAQQPDDQKELDQVLEALPELADDLNNSVETRSSNPRMKCFVDTPAFDTFTFGLCFNNGVALTTSAVFRIDSPPSNFTIIWSDSRCNSNSTTCILPIRQYTQVSLSATVLNNSNNTFTTTSATAFYEGFF